MLRTKYNWTLAARTSDAVALQARPRSIPGTISGKTALVWTSVAVRVTRGFEINMRIKECRKLLD